MLNINKLYAILMVLIVSAKIEAKPYIGGTFQDEIGRYDRPDIQITVEEANKVCNNMFKNDFIVEHWLYAPNRDEVYLTGRTHGWLFPKEASCSYRPSNKSATGSKYPSGFNIMGEHEKFKTDH